MRTHRIRLRRWFSEHRYQLALVTATGVVGVSLAACAPLLLTAAAVEWKLGHRRLLAIAILAALGRALVWLWQELRSHPHRRWHPCAQCGFPIEAPATAWYCSPACRRYARLERDAGSPDPWTAERAETRLRLVSRLDVVDPQSSEIPF